MVGEVHLEVGEGEEVAPDPVLVIANSSPEGPPRGAVDVDTLEDAIFDNLHLSCLACIEEGSLEDWWHVMTIGECGHHPGVFLIN